MAKGDDIQPQLTDKQHRRRQEGANEGFDLT